MKPYTQQALRKYESGQAIILIALMVIALLGITGLAIDGGGLYYLHRDTQNAVDAAVLAATYAKCTTDSDAGDIELAARNALSDNAYDDGINGTVITIITDYDPTTHAASLTPPTAYVKVTVTAAKPSYFIQLVYTAPLTVTTSGVGYCVPPGTSLLPDAAIVSLRPTSACNSNPRNASFNYGGTSYVYVHDSGIWVNSTSGCGVRQHGNGSITVDGACSVVGDINPPPSTPADPEEEVSCGSVPNVDSGDALTDLNPLSDLDRPRTCSGSPTTKSSGTIDPGYYNFDLGPGDELNLNPGIYCVDSISNKGHLNGDGVVIYMPASSSDAHDDRWTSNSNGAEMNLYAPTAANCVDTPTSGGNTCNWIGLLLWADIPYDNGCPGEDPCSGEVHLNGGSDSHWTGMVYAPGSDCTIEGHGTGFGMAAQYVCWGVRGEGNSGLDIYYEKPDFLQTPPRVSFAE